MTNRELDARVAVEVMGWVLIADGHCDECRELGEPVYQSEHGIAPVDHWSTDIAAAWEVWEHMKADSFRWAKFVRALPSCTDGVHLHGPLVPDVSQLNPTTICLAALEAMKVNA